MINIVENAAKSANYISEVEGLVCRTTNEELAVVLFSDDKAVVLTSQYGVEVFDSPEQLITLFCRDHELVFMRTIRDKNDFTLLLTV